MTLAELETGVVEGVLSVVFVDVVGALPETVYF